MANFINLVNEMLLDNETNEKIELTLNHFFHDQTEYYLADFDTNIEFILALVNKSIDPKNKTVNETELRNRAKLMNKYVIRDFFLYYLQLLLRIVNLCKSKGLPVNKIDAIVEILQRENVITSFIRSHWFCAKGSGDPSRIVEERCKAISQCIEFLSKMDDANDEL